MNSQWRATEENDDTCLALPPLAWAIASVEQRQGPRRLARAACSQPKRINASHPTGGVEKKREVLWRECARTMRCPSNTGASVWCGRSVTKRTGWSPSEVGPAGCLRIRPPNATGAQSLALRSRISWCARYAPTATGTRELRCPLGGPSHIVRKGYVTNRAANSATPRRPQASRVALLTRTHGPKQHITTRKEKESETRGDYYTIQTRVWPRTLRHTVWLSTTPTTGLGVKGSTSPTTTVVDIWTRRPSCGGSRRGRGI